MSESDSQRKGQQNFPLSKIDEPMPSVSDERVWGSDIIAQTIRNLKLDYIALNPGASFRGLHDSLVNHTGNRDPQMLLCLHEENAVSIAHGYAKVKERPMGVVLHSNVGLMHGSMGIFNAWCDRVPMVVLGATGPVDASQRRPWIDWLHTSADQGALVRDYTKWDDQPGSVSAAVESLIRAYQITQSAPKAPVYVNIDASLQEEVVSEKIDLPDLRRYQPAALSMPNDNAIAEARKIMADAKKLVMLVGRVSRQENDWERRITLAEELSAYVVTDLKLGAGFPTNHPQHVGPPGFFLAPQVIALLRDADVILSLDWLDLAGTLKQAFADGPPTAKIIHTSLDQQLHRGWGAEYFGLPPIDLYFTCDSDTFTAALIEHVKPSKSSRYAAVAREERSVDQVSIKAIADSLNKNTQSQDICLARLPLGWNGGYRDFSHPLDYLGYDGGGGIGSGPGMCVGAALALQGTSRIAVGVIGDGDFLMGVTALWTACHYKIPVLFIVANNNSFFNDEMHQERVAKERGRPVGNRWIGQRISDPDIDLAAMARAQGAKAFGPITDLQALDECVTEGLRLAREGNVVVLDVRVVPGYDTNLSGQVDRTTTPTPSASNHKEA
jgi:thiamine pyrophosphate-dependent acetolactate synthase large subunit-like protein